MEGHRIFGSLGLDGAGDIRDGCVEITKSPEIQVVGTERVVCGITVSQSARPESQRVPAQDVPVSRTVQCVHAVGARTCGLKYIRVGFGHIDWALCVIVTRDLSVDPL